MRPSLLLLLLAIPASAADPEPLVRLGSDRFRQTDRVTAMTYSPDGKHLASADREAVHIWDAANGKPVRTVELKNSSIFAVGYGDRGRVLLVGARRRDRQATELIRIDPASGNLLQGIRLADVESDGLFSPDGAWLILVEHGANAKCRAVNTENGKTAWVEPTQSRGHRGFAAFRPDGKVVAVAESSGLIVLREPATGKILGECRVQGGTTYSLTYSPDGEDLIVDVGNAIPDRVKRIKAETGKERWTSPAWEANEFAFTADGKAVRYFGLGITRSGYPEWHWLDAGTGKRLNMTMEGEAGGAFATRPDGKILAGGGNGGHIWQWDLETQRRMGEASADPIKTVSQLRFTADGSAVRGWATGWYEWDLKTGGQSRLSPKLDPWATKLMAVSDDQKLLARVLGEPYPFSGTLDVIDLPTGRRRKTEFETKFNYGLRFRSDGQLESFDEGGLSIFDLSTGKLAVRVQADGRRRTIAASEDGRTAVKVALEDGRLDARVWDLATRKPAAEWENKLADLLPEPRESELRPKLSPDGRLLAVSIPSTGELEMQLMVFDTRTGHRHCRWSARWYGPPSAFSPDGRSVAGQNFNAFEVREVATGGRRARWIERHEVSAAAFSPDGRVMALVSPPGPVALWDLIGKPTNKWADEKPDRLWADLAGDDAERAFDVIRHLRQHPAEAVGFLKQRMKLPAAPTADWIAGRLKGLDAPQFRDREKATGELAGAGERIAPQLRAALKTASPEARERITGLLAKVDVMTSERLRAIRACEVLEGIGSPAARDLLAAWAKGPPGATLTREASESLERLKVR